MSKIISLSEEQHRSIGYVMDPSYRVAVLTGPAGTGKSTIIRELKSRGNVTVCATTGKAGMNIGGPTLDKVFGISRDPYKLFNRGYTDWSMSKTAGTILIDEASMIGGAMGQLLYDTAQSYGKRLIMVGDWGQAAPVKDVWGFSTPLFTNAHLVRLTECHRQSAGVFLSALNKMRLGIVDQEVADVFGSVAGKPMPPKEFEGICMFGTNRRTDAYNFDCMEAHRSETGHWSVPFNATVQDRRPMEKQEKKPLTERDIEKMIDDSNLAHCDQFAIGVKVVCTRNHPLDDFMNGTMGTITEVVFNDGSRLSEIESQMVTDHNSAPVAVILRGFDGSMITVSHMDIEVKDSADRVEYVVRGLPLKLGYGLTIHKSQGMTVDSAWVDMESIGSFPEGSRHGLAYVALSRTRTLEGLQLSGWRGDVVECNDIVKPWL
jgi:ATP-dependent DNA helicase PIF1